MLAPEPPKQYLTTYAHYVQNIQLYSTKKVATGVTAQGLAIQVLTMLYAGHAHVIYTPLAHQESHPGRPSLCQPAQLRSSPGSNY